MCFLVEAFKNALTNDFMDFFFFLMYEKNGPWNMIEYICLSHFAWCETTAPNDINGIYPHAFLHTCMCALYRKMWKLLYI